MSASSRLAGNTLTPLRRDGLLLTPLRALRHLHCASRTRAPAAPRIVPPPSQLAGSLEPCSCRRDDSIGYCYSYFQNVLVSFAPCCHFLKNSSPVNHSAACSCCGTFLHGPFSGAKNGAPFISSFWASLTPVYLGIDHSYFCVYSNFWQFMERPFMSLTVPDIRIKWFFSSFVRTCLLTHHYR